MTDLGFAIATNFPKLHVVIDGKIVRGTFAANDKLRTFGAKHTGILLSYKIDSRQYVRCFDIPDLLKQLEAAMRREGWTP